MEIVKIAQKIIFMGSLNLLVKIIKRFDAILKLGIKN